ncbi:MAG: ATPase [Microbacterium sp.]|uniref:ATPase n=1 Tax=Microbacterium sp. TaxID=51671 RepID=UPI002619E797|nr:ATPase [Microbacterium sp.]MCX6503523.1 ATPase [Microbacterium sp.]
MKNLVWFVLGAGAGFVLAHVVNKDPRGHELLGEIDARISEFTDRIGDAYREQQTRLNDLVAEVTDAASDAVKLAD